MKSCDLYQTNATHVSVCCPPGAQNSFYRLRKPQSIFNKPLADFSERGVYAASMPPRQDCVEAAKRACVKNPWLRFVLLLDFAGDFEDEDDDENEEDGGSGYFSHRL